MGIVVQKYGGSSVADADGIKRVAQRIVNTKKQGHEVVVVVSAMGDTTDDLRDLAEQVTPLPPPRELDMLLTAGERISMALLAMAVSSLGHEAQSFTGSQAGVITDSVHGKAKIIDITPGRIKSAIDEGHVAIVAGFQGVSQDTKDVTTLGRGGTDTTAVALAAALGAERCDIYTDVEGVYTSDPRIVAKARKLEKITYEEMLEMASLGAKVLQTRAVELAMKSGQRLHVRSSYSDAPGTLVVDEDEIVEQEIVSGIAYSREEAKISLVQVAEKPGVAAAIFGPLADASINVDMIVQNVSADGKTTDLTFTVAKGDLERAVETVESNKKKLQYKNLISDSDVVKVQAIGVGMRSHAGVAQRMFKALAEKGINIQVISTSEIKISVLIAEEYTELALRALHSAYGLDVE